MKTLSIFSGFAAAITSKQLVGALKRLIPGLCMLLVGCASMPKTNYALYDAIQSNDVTTVHRILDSGADVNISSNNFTPLHASVYWGRRDIAELLLNKGADVNAKTKTGMTPLMLATFGGNPFMVELLLNKGADISASDSKTNTAISLAACRGHKEAMVMLMAKGAQMTAQDMLVFGFCCQRGIGVPKMPVRLLNGIEMPANSAT